MSVVENEPQSRTHEFTPEQAMALLDRRARYYLNMSGEEFMRAWEAGEFADDPDRPAVTRVAMLLPFGRHETKRGGQQLRRSHPQGDARQPAQSAQGAMMELRYDERADAAAVDVYGRIVPGTIDFTDELDQDRNVMYDAEDRIIGYRFLNVKRYGVRLGDLEHRDELARLFAEAGFSERDWGTPHDAGRRLTEPPARTKAIVERWRRARRDATSHVNG